MRAYVLIGLNLFWVGQYSVFRWYHGDTMEYRFSLAFRCRRSGHLPYTQVTVCSVMMFIKHDLHVKRAKREGGPCSRLCRCTDANKFEIMPACS